MGVYDMFSTDTSLETEGIDIDYGEFSIKIARAGGANKRYVKVLEAKSKPYRRAIDTDTIDSEIVQRILRETYATTVVLGWKGITDSEGKAIKFSKESCVKLFEDLPDLFIDIQQQASKMALFRKEILEADSKN